jgi:hypothetical protein
MPSFSIFYAAYLIHVVHRYNLGLQLYARCNWDIYLSNAPPGDEKLISQLQNTNQQHLFGAKYFSAIIARMSKWKVCIMDPIMCIL